MKRLFTILSLIASIFAIIFSVLPISNLAIFPAIVAVIFGVFALYLSKKTGQVKKIIQFTFLLTAMAFAITTYKAFFTKTEVENTEILDAKETQFEEEAIEELEGLEIETTDIESVKIENEDIDATELENLDLSN